MGTEKGGEQLPDPGQASRAASDPGEQGWALGSEPEQPRRHPKGRINRQGRASERQMAIHAAARFQGIRSTHCAREGPGSNASPKYWVSRVTFPSRNSMMLTV